MGRGVRVWRGLERSLVHSEVVPFLLPAHLPFSPDPTVPWARGWSPNSPGHRRTLLRGPDSLSLPSVLGTPHCSHPTPLPHPDSLPFHTGSSCFALRLKFSFFPGCLPLLYCASTQTFPPTGRVSFIAWGAQQALHRDLTCVTCLSFSQSRTSWGVRPDLMNT